MAVKPNLPKGKGASNKGEVRGKAMAGDDYAKPMDLEPDTNINGMAGTFDDIGEKSGFQTDGYIVKKGTPYGESAKFNYLPPGMDIDNQENKDIRSMPYKEVVEQSFPGDGWEPKPRKGE
jgi:hypothetical protein